MAQENGVRGKRRHSPVYPQRYMFEHHLKKQIASVLPDANLPVATANVVVSNADNPPVLRQSFSSASGVSDPVVPCPEDIEPASPRSAGWLEPSELYGYRLSRGGALRLVPVKGHLIIEDQTTPYEHLKVR